MKIPAEKEFAMKKAILKAIELGKSPAQLALSFGVSKSTIYKYRRMLRDQGFIYKNENDIYVVTENKFSSKEKNPKSGSLFSESELDKSIKNTEQLNEHNIIKKIQNQQVEYTENVEILNTMNKVLQDRKKDKLVEANAKSKGLLNKFFKKIAGK